MGRKSKKSNPTRYAAEFDLARLLQRLKTPHQSPSAFAWSLEKIRAARDEQMRGVFRTPAQLARAMRTDDALFFAYRNRLAPLRSVDVEITPARSSKPAENIAGEAAALYGRGGSALSIETLASVNGDLADHSVAFMSINAVPREDGSRIDLVPCYWPIDWVRWDTTRRCFVTQVELDEAAQVEAEATGSLYGPSQIEITHGDGRWIVVTTREHEPWAHEACVIPGALVWAGRAFGVRDWTKNSYAHGSAKAVGELPEGVALTNGDGAPTPEALAFLEMLSSLMSGDSLVGIRPSGSKNEWLAPNGTNWQVFAELITNRDKAAARIYLGTDAILGSQGGAPGVDISALFGIASTIMQGDAEAIEQALYTGLLQPWAAINFGDSSLAPRRKYQLPDSDAERWTDDFAKRNAAFHEAVAAERQNGFDVTQDRVDELAKKYRVPAPTLKLKEQPSEQPTPQPSNGALKPNGAGAAVS